MSDMVKVIYSSVESRMRALHRHFKSGDVLMTGDDLLNIIESNPDVFFYGHDAFYLLHRLCYRKRSFYFISFFREVNRYNEILRAEGSDSVPSLYEHYELGFFDVTAAFVLRSLAARKEIPLLFEK